MSISYDVFTGAFLGKVTEYDFLRLDDHDRNATVDGYMKRACAEFNKICKYDLLERDRRYRIRGDARTVDEAVFLQSRQP